MSEALSLSKNRHMADSYLSSNISIGIPYTFLMIYEEKSRIRKRVYSLMINGQSVLIFKDFYDKQSLQ